MLDQTTKKLQSLKPKSIEVEVPGLQRLSFTSSVVSGD